MTSQQPVLATSAWPPAKRLFLLLLLCVMAAINLIDRQLITILMEPIKREFNASDTMMGLLTGLSFAIVYVTAALPIARWSDRSVRRDIISICVFMWGSMTMLFGILNDYLQPSLGVESVRYSLMILLSGCLVAAWASFSTNQSVTEDMRWAQAN